jgi:hypothetical protein
MSFKLNPYIFGRPVPVVEPGAEGLQCYPNICFFVGKCHRVDNNVKTSLTFSAPLIRQMAITNFIAPSTATTLHSATKSVIGKDREVRIGFGSFKKIPNLKLKKF